MKKVSKLILGLLFAALMVGAGTAYFTGTDADQLIAMAVLPAAVGGLSVAAKLQNPKLIFSQFAARFKNQLSQNKVFCDIIYFHAQKVTSLTEVTFFNDKAAGFNNLKSDRLPEGEPFIIQALRLLEGINANLKATAWTEGISTAALQNAYIVVTVNGADMTYKIPLTAFVEADEDSSAGWFQLTEYIEVPAQAELKIRAVFPVAPAALDQNLRIELKGLGLA